MNRVILHVDLDAFFASVEEQEKPWLRGKPVLVAGNYTHRTVVATASYSARRYGIKTGMPLSQARRLCPEGIVVVGDPAKYVNISRQIFHHCYLFTPLVEIYSIDEAFLDLTYVGLWRDRSIEAARQIQDWVRKEFGLTCSAGIAPNKLLAKLASGIEKPNGLTSILPSQVSFLLESLPVEKLCGIGPKTQVALSEMGILTCGQLGRIPVAQLTNRFGVIGYTLKEMGQGKDDTLVVPSWSDPPVKSMGHSHTLDQDTLDVEEIRATLLMLSEKVGHRLRAENYRGCTVVLTLRYSNFETISRHKTFSSYIHDGYQIYQRALEILETVFWYPRKIRLLGVSVTHLIRHEKQLSFFSEDQQREDLDKTMDQINGRWGQNTLVRATLLSSKAPERHYQIKQVRGRLIPLMCGVLLALLVWYSSLHSCRAQEYSEEIFSGVGRGEREIGYI